MTYKVTLSARIPLRSGQTMTQAEIDGVKALLQATDIADWLKARDPAKWIHLDSVMDTIIINYQV